MAELAFGEAFKGLASGLGVGLQYGLEAKKLKIAEELAKLDRTSKKAELILKDRALKIKGLEEKTKLLNAIGGISVKDKTIAESISKEFNLPMSFWSQERNKDNEPTGRMTLIDPDSQKKEMDRLKLDLQRQGRALQLLNTQISAANLKLGLKREEREEEKFGLFKETPQTTITTEKGIEGVLPGGKTTLLGQRPTPQISAGERATIAETEAGIASLNELERLFKGGFTGAIKGRISQVKQLWGGNPEAQSDFLAQSAVVENEMIKLISGATVPKQEEVRIMKQVPRPTDHPTAWKSHLKQTKKNKEFLLKNIRKGLKKSEVVTPDFDKMTENQLERYINGRMSTSEFNQIMRK